MSNNTQLSARERIDALLDQNSFVEIGALVTKRSTDFNLSQKEVPSDGVITGYGMIQEKPVYVYSQDIKAMNGTMGEMHAKKISNLYDLALKTGAPVIGLLDCAGLRLEEATDALAGFGDLYKKQTLASGVIPQISAVFGTCGGGSAVSALMSDFVFMETTSSRLFVNAPNTLLNNSTEKCDTAKAAFMGKSGVCDFVCENEESLLSQMRALITILPANNEDESCDYDSEDDLNRLTPSLQDELSDVTYALKDFSDNSLIVEVKKENAPEMVTAFIKINGSTVGAVANRTAVIDENGKTVSTYENVLTTEGCEKAIKFVKFCDAFNIPVLTLTNVKGYAATVEEEKTIAKACAGLTYAFASATVPKINLVTKEAYGSAYITMNSKHIGADFVYALENAKIGTMDAKLAAQILCPNDLQAQQKKANEYDELQQSAVSAAKRGYVDAILSAESARQNIIYAFEMLASKRENRPAKKHGTI